MPGTNGKTLDRDQVDALKASIDLADFIRHSGLELRREGKNQVARCPFHEDTDASFVVNSERQLWNCFGCHQGGDVFSFLELKDGLKFPQALEYLQAFAQSAPPPPPRPTLLDANAPLAGGFSRSELLGRVVDFYVRQLGESQEARAYLLPCPKRWTHFASDTATASRCCARWRRPASYATRCCNWAY
jgi:DNA primase